MVTDSKNIQFYMDSEDTKRLEGLPWDFPLEEWSDHGVIPLSIRRGESRHPVIFVERESFRYAIKETTPHMAEREISSLREIERRGIPALSPVGCVTVPAAPILIEAAGPGSVPQYISGDRGYTVTRLAPRVIPQVLLFRMPFTRKNKRRIWSAVAILLVELHEHGVFWGDPSLANILVRIDGRSILAIMADAETTELFPGPVNDHLREQDLDLFRESLLWQTEDLRRAQNLPEEDEIVDDRDFRYIEQRYNWLRREHEQLTSPPAFTTVFQAQRMLESFNRLGFSLLDMGTEVVQQLTTVLPGWYQRRIHDLLGITVPRRYARRFYNGLLGHQAIMSKNEGRDVSLEEATQDYYTRYHLPMILLLRKYLTKGEDPLQAYFSLLHYRWKLSNKVGREIPMDEAIVDWAMTRTDTGSLGAVDPATISTWWHNREPVTEVLEPAMIESAQLEPLLSEEEQPLVRLPTSVMEHKLNEMLEQHSNGEEDD